MAYEQALQALADPLRAGPLVQQHGPTSVGTLAESLPISRPAVSQHLKILKDAGLVSERREGVRRIYGVEIRGLVELRQYLDRFWGVALDAFQHEVEHGKPDNER